MKRGVFIALLLTLFHIIGVSQGVAKPGNVIEYVLPAEDNKTGQFYIGQFTTGTYEISCNVSGIHANYRGWKIAISKNWSISDIPKLMSIYNYIGGSFYVQNLNDDRFDLWWDSNSSVASQLWTPFLKVEYQQGFINYTATEPARTAATELLSPLTYNSSGNIGIGTNNPLAKLHVNNGDNSCGAILAQANESNFQLYTKTLTTQPTSVESFRLGLKYGSDENNSFISFYRGGGTSGGFVGLSTNGIERFRITTDGKVGIGTANPKNALDVVGTIRAKEIKVEAAPWPDYVFADDYPLKELSEVEQYIDANKHLPDVPSAETMDQQGINLGEMNRILLKKVEELTLYCINQNKTMAENEKLMDKKDLEMQQVKGEIDSLKKQLEELLKITKH
jgi:hypothetical protein